MREKYRPFSCGTQAVDWMASNCDRCTKGGSAGVLAACPILYAIIDAWYGDGDVSAEVASRMGYLDGNGDPNRNYVWPCSEVEWQSEWKAEYRRLRPERSRS